MKLFAWFMVAYFVLELLSRISLLATHEYPRPISRVAEAINAAFTLLLIVWGAAVIALGAP